MRSVVSEVVALLLDQEGLQGEAEIGSEHVLRHGHGKECAQPFLCLDTRRVVDNQRVDVTTLEQAPHSLLDLRHQDRHR